MTELKKELEKRRITIEWKAFIKNVDIMNVDLLIYLSVELAEWIDCSPMVRETGDQSQVESYQRLKKWYLIPPCSALSIMK